MRTLVSNAAVGVLVIVPMLVVMVAHEVLAALAGGQGRFATARRRLSVVVAILGVALMVVIVARFYYLRN